VARQPYLGEQEEADAVAAIRRYVEARDDGTWSPRWVRRLRARAAAARALLVCSHLRLVVAIAGPYGANPRVDVDDLVQEGNLALIMAVERFATHGRGRFAGFAHGPVRAAVSRAADLAGHPATVPERLLRQARHLDRLRRDLPRYGPAERQQARALLGVSEERLRDLERVLTPPLLLSTPLGDSALTVGDTLHYRSEVDAVGIDAEGPSALAAITGHLRDDTLTAQEERVLRDRFGVYTGILRAGPNLHGDMRSFAQVAASLNISESQARALCGRALAKLRRAPGVDALAADPTRTRHAADPEDVESWYLTELGRRASA
jgi:RNA polymerase sigma factor (sigma-70 family)